jgi:hypothetical protein
LEFLKIGIINQNENFDKIKMGINIVIGVFLVMELITFSESKGMT